MKKFAKNIIRGASSVINILPEARTARQTLHSSPQSVRDALTRDWEKVGQDLGRAFETGKRAYGQEKK